MHYLKESFIKIDELDEFRPHRVEPP